MTSTKRIVCRRHRCRALSQTCFGSLMHRTWLYFLLSSALQLFIKSSSSGTESISINENLHSIQGRRFLPSASGLKDKKDSDHCIVHNNVNEKDDHDAVDDSAGDDPIESTKAFYNEYVDEYIKNINIAGVTHIPDEHLDRFVHYVQTQHECFAQSQQKRHNRPFKRILELGCGYGRDARRLANSKNFNVLATDYSRSMLLKALQTQQEHQEKEYGELHGSDASTAGESDTSDSRIHYLELDMRHIHKHFLPASIDGIWACATIIHIPKADIVDLFNRLYRILCDGGILYVSVKQGVEGETFNPDKRYGGIKKFYTFFQNQQELIEMLETAGFDILECNTEDHRNHDTYATHPFIHVFAQKSAKLVLETTVD